MIAGEDSSDETSADFCLRPGVHHKPGMCPRRTRCVGSCEPVANSIRRVDNYMKKLMIAVSFMLAAVAGNALAGTVTDDTTTTKTKSTKSHKKKTTDTTATAKATTAAADTGKMAADATKTAGKAASDGGKMAASDTKMASDKMTSTAKKATTAPKQVASAADIAAAKASGKVWVNKNTKVYHMSSSKYYGATSSGAFMTEADAKAAGYHASKNRD
jgi:hypothetical protein